MSFDAMKLIIVWLGTFGVVCGVFLFASFLAWLSEHGRSDMAVVSLAIFAATLMTVLVVI